MGRELLEAKRIEEENERKRLVELIYFYLDIGIIVGYAQCAGFCSYSILALRKAEKAEEQRAREKIRQKLEEDKVLRIFSKILFDVLIMIQQVSCNPVYSLADIRINSLLDDLICLFWAFSNGALMFSL